MSLVGPKKTAKECGLVDRDLHLVVNDEAETAKLFSGDGTLLRTIPALARGQWGDTEWARQHGDTPPGLWAGGRIYRDYEHPETVDYRTRMAYGWYSIALEGLEGQEQRYGRAGIMVHGGGSALGDKAWSPLQPLIPTLGCIRLRNQDLLNIVKLIDSRGGVKLFVSVFQEGW